MKPRIIRCPKRKTTINFSDLDPDFSMEGFESYLPDATLSISYRCCNCEHEGQIYYGAIDIS